MVCFNNAGLPPSLSLVSEVFVSSVYLGLSLLLVGLLIVVGFFGGLFSFGLFFVQSSEKEKSQVSSFIKTSNFFFLLVVGLLAWNMSWFFLLF